MCREHRREERQEITVAGRYRARQGGARDVWIKDVSEFGCRFFDKFSILAVGTQISVRIGNIGPIGADVRWRKGSIVGARFEDPLHPSVLGHIVAAMDRGEH